MADDYFNPIINKMHSLATSNLNTEIDAIDSTLPDVETNKIYKSRQPFAQGWPIVEIFEVGESDVDADFVGDPLQFVLFIATTIRIIEDKSSESEGQIAIRKYLTALMKTMIKGATNNWDLDDTVDLIFPTRIAFATAEEPEISYIARGGTIIWQLMTNLDPTT